MKNKLKNTFCRSWMEVDTNAMRSRNLNQVQSLMFQPLQKSGWWIYCQWGEMVCNWCQSCRLLFIQAVIQDGDDVIGDALFFLDMDQEGIEHVRTPLFSHTFDSHHPIYKFHDVFIPEENLIGSENDGMSYSLAWFRRERLMIAARCCGAAARLIEEASEFAQARKVKGGLLSEQQAIQFMLADSVTELWATRLMLYETAMAHDREDDVKALHYRCSAVKLYASEMANKVADRVVQIFGGRGYMREFAAERFYRELRVDRIWEGPRSSASHYRWRPS